MKLWATANWQHVRTLKKHSGSVNSVAFSPNGRLLASASSDRTVKIWDTETGAEVSTLLGHTQFVVGLAFSPDSKRLVSASEDCTLRIWDTETKENVLILHGHRGMVNCVAYSPDGKSVASASDDKTVKLWNVEQPTFAQSLGGVGRNWFTRVAFSPDGQYLAAVNVDRTVNVWERPSYQVRQTLPEHKHPIWGVAFSRNGLVAAACGDSNRAEQSSEVRVSDWRTGRSVPLPLRVNVVWSVAFSPDDRLMAAGGGDLEKETAELKVWDTKTWRVIHELKGHTRGVSCVSFSPVGQALASAANDGTVRLWNSRTGAHTLTLEVGEPPLFGVAFSQDGKTLATAGAKSVTIWSLATQKKLQILRGHLGTAQQAAFHPNGKRLASAGYDGTVRIWDVDTGQEILTLRGHRGPVCDVAFSPDGRQLGSASRDGTVKIWDGTPWPMPSESSAP